MGLVAASWRVMLALWVLALFGSVWLHLPEPVRYSKGLFTFGVALVLAAFHLFVSLAATSPLRRRLRELRQSTGAIVELVGLDPAWLPVDGGSTGAHRPGLLIADGTGIRLTDLDQAEAVLDAAWSDSTRRDRPWRSSWPRGGGSLSGGPPRFPTGSCRAPAGCGRSSPASTRCARHPAPSRFARGSRPRTRSTR